MLENLLIFQVTSENMTGIQLFLLHSGLGKIHMRLHQVHAQSNQSIQSETRERLVIKQHTHGTNK